MKQALSKFEAVNLHYPELKTSSLSKILDLNYLPLGKISMTTIDEIQYNTLSDSQLKRLDALGHHIDQKMLSHTLPADPKHDAASFLDMKKDDPHLPFEYKGNNQTRNQDMIIEKLCQYLTLTGQDTDIIPKIQGGICVPLSFLFIHKNSDEWDQFITAISNWDAKGNSHQISEHFNKLLKYVKVYQFNQGEKQLIGDDITSFLRENAKEGGKFILCNEWHDTGLKYERGSWHYYNPNFVSGKSLSFSADQLDNLADKIYNTFGKVLSVRSKTYMGPPIQPIINNIPNFIKEGGLLCCMFTVNHIKLMGCLRETNIEALTYEVLHNGLLIRTTKAIPTWLLGLNSDYSLFFLSLIRQCLKLKPDTFINEFKVSADRLSPEERYNYSRMLSRLNNKIPQEYTEVINALSYIPRISVGLFLIRPYI